MKLGLAYHYSSADRGLVITSVDSRGSAYEAGLEAGDLILAADGLPTADGDVLSLLEKSAGDSIEIIVRPRPKPSGFDRAIGTPLMGGLLKSQAPRTVTLVYKDLPSQTIFDHITAFFSNPLPSRRAEDPPVSTIFGVGIAFEVRRGITTVSDMAPGGPAEVSSSIFRGDEIFAIDGQEITGLDHSTVKGLLLGRNGSEVCLTVQPHAGGEQVTVRLSRSFPVGTPVLDDDPFDMGAPREPPRPRFKPGWLGKEFGK